VGDKKDKKTADFGEVGCFQGKS